MSILLVLNLSVDTPTVNVASVSSSSSNTFIVLYYNARSLLPKFDDLCAVIAALNPDIVCIVESWLCSDISVSEISVPGYQIIRLDRNRHGGGVLFYLKNIFVCQILPFSNSLEILSIVIGNGHGKVCISLFYRPPSSPVDIFDNLFLYLSQLNFPQFSNFILLGDFNVNFYNSNHYLFHKLQDIFNSLGLTQVVNSPTHLSSSGSSLIDLVFLSSPSFLQTCSTLPPLLNSDHLGLFIRLRWQKSNRSTSHSSRTIWRYDFADWDRACDLISSTDWESVLDFDDVNDCWLNLKSHFLEIIELCVPKAVLPKRQNLPWLTKPIIQAIRRRNLLFKQAKLSGDFTKYKACRNKIVQQLRLAKQQFFSHLDPKCPKNFWKAYKILNGSPSSIPVLSSGSTVAESSIEKANLLNEFFVSCFNTSTPPLDADNSFLSPVCPDLFPDDLLCTEEDVFDLLVSLNVTKSSGPDNISPHMLKFTAGAIAPGLTLLFNKSLKSGVVPKEWKIARITPVPKVSSPKTPDNFRPISLLSLLCKTLERHVCNKLVEYIDDHNLLSNAQWGFRAGRSTVSALVSSTSTWFNDLDIGHDICSIFFDYKKAFDSVPHRPLLDKLVSFNFNMHLIHWIANYLTNRI